MVILVPTPIPVILAMSIGQIIGTASLLFYLFAIVSDLRQRFVLAKTPARPAPAAPIVEKPAA